MMKKVKNAFTLIELIVSISIIILVSLVSVSGFFDFLDGREANIKMNEFSEIINSFDKKVKNREIFDYKIVLDTSANDSFIVYENIFTSDYVINLNNQGVISDEDLDLKKHELILNEDLKENETLKIIIFKEDKLEKSDSSTGKIYSFYFNNGYNYKINSSVGATKINNIEFLRLDKENKEFTLSKISENGNQIQKLEIINVGGKKEFFSNGSNLSTNGEIFIYFNYRGKDHFLKLTKY